MNRCQGLVETSVQHTADIGEPCGLRAGHLGPCLLRPSPWDFVTRGGGTTVPCPEPTCRALKGAWCIRQDGSAPEHQNSVHLARAFLADGNPRPLRVIAMVDGPDGRQTVTAIVDDVFAIRKIMQGARSEISVGYRPIRIPTVTVRPPLAPLEMSVSEEPLPRIGPHESRRVVSLKQARESVKLDMRWDPTLHNGVRVQQEATQDSLFAHMKQSLEATAVTKAAEAPRSPAMSSESDPTNVRPVPATDPLSDPEDFFVPVKPTSERNGSSKETRVFAIAKINALADKDCPLAFLEPTLVILLEFAGLSEGAIEAFYQFTKEAHRQDDPAGEVIAFARGQVLAIQTIRDGLSPQSPTGASRPTNVQEL